MTRQSTWTIAALAAIAILVALSIGSTLSATQSWRAARLAEQESHAIAESVDAVRGGVQDAVIGHHGFLLTGQPGDLAPYREALPILRAELARLRQRAQADPTVLGYLPELEQFIELRLTALARSIMLAEAGDREAARAVALADAGLSSTVARVRVLLSAIERASTLHRAVAVAEANRIERWMRRSAAATSLVALAAAAVTVLLLLRGNVRLRRAIDRRAQAEAVLRESEERNRAYFQHSGDALFVAERRADRAWVYAEVNPEKRRLLAGSGGFVGATVGEELQASLDRCAELSAPMRYEERLGTDAGERIFDIGLVPLRGEQPQVDRILGSARDITEQRRTEDALRQSQKMEAVGQLTGGIAHDFNNLLQVVLASLEMVAGTAQDPNTLRRVRNAIAAADRGQRLTRQLLAFSRQQTLEPAVLSPAWVVREMEPLIRSSIGEKSELALDLPEDVWPVLVDRTQVETALLNLIVNARDAMPQGGRLAVALDNVTLDAMAAAHHADATPGEYVRVRVSDTGAGIPPELLERVFVPFFTTKPVGRGTGLGLSMVYGLARQLGGHVVLDSKLGRGTTVALYLPRSEAAAAPAESDATEMPRGSEAILVAEDDAAVRDSTVETLRGLGYIVTPAADGDAALGLLRDGPAVDLLLSDVVMPGALNGLELLRAARAMRPALRVLLTSGYPDDPATRAAEATEGIDLLAKPFRASQLARAVRAALDRAEPAALPAGIDPGAVLIVEDDPLVRAVAVDTLSAAGFRCIEAATGPQGLARLREIDTRLAALVTDLRLPDLPGQHLVAAARRLRPSMPIVVTTGYGARGSVTQFAGLPDVEILGKPYASERLLRLVRRAVAARRAAQPERLHG